MAQTLNKIHSIWWGFLTTLFFYGFTLLVYYLWFQDLSKIAKYVNFLLFTFVLSTIILTLIIQTISLRQRKKDLKAFSAIIPNVSETENLDFQDITHKINTITEDQNKEIDFLKERENYRREFLGNISHELKTPLFSVQGYLLTLIEGGLEDEKIRDKYLNRINKSVDRLIYMVSDLDMITELERGKLQLNQSAFNITALVQEVIDLLEIKAENKNIELSIVQPVLSNVRVKGDLEKIQQVLINLIANAINYSENGSKVSLKISEEDNQIRIDVKDKGVGMKESDLERIFERFYRVEKSRNRNQGGTGLGLAIVKHILEAHNQKITVKSKLGKGSTFSFYLDKL